MTNGWLGFRNTASGNLLGQDAEGNLSCFAEHHQPCEYFFVRMKPEGGCVLIMVLGEELWHVGIIKTEQGIEKLANFADKGIESSVWEFVKMQDR